MLQVEDFYHFDGQSRDYAIAGNRFRAYRDYSLPPSKVYRHWASLKTEDVLVGHFPSMTDQRAFAEWHRDSFESIYNHWFSEQGQKISFAHTSKLLDLYLKWLMTNQKCPDQLASAILHYGDCALDSQILFRLNQCLSGALPIKNSTMGHILNRNTYVFCQELIKDFAEKFGGTRILFDFYAWEPGGFQKTRS